MTHFSQRYKIEQDFRAWASLCGAAETPMNVVAFLQLRGLLNEEKIEAEYPIKQVLMMNQEAETWEN